MPRGGGDVAPEAELLASPASHPTTLLCQSGRADTPKTMSVVVAELVVLQSECSTGKTG